MSTLMTLLVVLLVGGFAFLVAYYVSSRVTQEVATLKATAEQEKKPAKRGWFVDAWNRRVDPFMPRGVGDGIGKQISMAGGLEGLTAAELFLYVTVAALVGLTLSLWISVMSGWSLWIVVLGCLAGALYPFIWLRDRVKERHLEIQRDLPYHIDLLTLCVEAGLDFGAGVARTVEKGKPGPLRDELMTFLAEVRVGKSRAEALDAMGVRVGLNALSNFLAALIQADRMGSGLGRTLRLQAEQLRNERFQRAEQLAGEAPVKIIVPLVLFIFPTIWIILAAPLVFEWIFRGGP